MSSSFNISDEIRTATFEFMKTSLKGDLTSAIERLIKHAHSIGLRSPHLPQYYTLNDTDALYFAMEEYYNRITFGGDAKIGKYVEEVFMTVAVQAAYSNPNRKVEG